MNILSDTVRKIKQSSIKARAASRRRIPGDYPCFCFAYTGGPSRTAGLRLMAERAKGATISKAAQLQDHTQ